jgi:hypothetical protein
MISQSYENVTLTLTTRGLNSGPYYYVEWLTTGSVNEFVPAFFGTDVVSLPNIGSTANTVVASGSKYLKLSDWPGGDCSFCNESRYYSIYGDPFPPPAIINFYYTASGTNPTGSLTIKTNNTIVGSLNSFGSGSVTSSIYNITASVVSATSSSYTSSLLTLSVTGSDGYYYTQSATFNRSIQIAFTGSSSEVYTVSASLFGIAAPPPAFTGSFPNIPGMVYRYDLTSTSSYSGTGNYWYNIGTAPQLVLTSSNYYPAYQFANTGVVSGSYSPGYTSIKAWHLGGYAGFLSVISGSLTSSLSGSHDITIIQLARYFDDGPLDKGSTFVLGATGDNILTPRGGAYNGVNAQSSRAGLGIGFELQGLTNVLPNYTGSLIVQWPTGSMPSTGYSILQPNTSLNSFAMPVFRYSSSVSFGAEGVNMWFSPTTATYTGTEAQKSGSNYLSEFGGGGNVPNIRITGSTVYDGSFTLRPSGIMGINGATPGYADNTAERSPVDLESSAFLVFDRYVTDSQLTQIYNYYTASGYNITYRFQ